MLIQLTDVKKIYRTDEVQTNALNTVNIQIQKGEFVAIMGPSGCGKSTLLNILGMLDSPSEGSYQFMNEEISNYSETQLSSLRKKNIGFIFQSFNLVDELSVEANIDLALLYHKIPSNERKQRVQEVMEKMNISHRAKHMPSQLSGGQQQRVAVARALIAKPNLILADEPTGNLDSMHGEEVMEMLINLNKQGTTVVMVTHSPEFAQQASRIIHLFDGQVVSENLKKVEEAPHATAEA